MNCEHPRCSNIEHNYTVRYNFRGGVKARQAENRRPGIHTADFCSILLFKLGPDSRKISGYALLFQSPSPKLTSGISEVLGVLLVDGVNTAKNWRRKWFRDAATIRFLPSIIPTPFPKTGSVRSNTRQNRGTRKVWIVVLIPEKKRKGNFHHRKEISRRTLGFWTASHRTRSAIADVGRPASDRSASRSMPACKTAPPNRYKQKTSSAEPASGQCP